MSSEASTPKRFIGLDIHKHYLVATGVDEGQNQVFGPRRVQLSRLAGFVRKHFRPTDALVIEMTTNTWQIYDRLEPHVHSVTVVHPPHVALITRTRVKTDKKAALSLAQLLAAGLLTSIWVPPKHVRDLRALVAQRMKMVRLVNPAKNRLHNVIHRDAFSLPEGALFSKDNRDWWLNLPVSELELAHIQSDLETLDFANAQVKHFEKTMAVLASEDERTVLLIQLPGIRMINALTILAAIGEIERFPSAKKLVGYAGLGASVHISGMTHRSGRITKTGRKDLRSTMVRAAFSALQSHPRWKKEFERLEPRLGRSKATVAIARKLLVAVWYVLMHGEADRHAVPQRVARDLMVLTMGMGKVNRPEGWTTMAYVRYHLDRLGLGEEVDFVQWSPSRKIILPPPGSVADPT